MTKQEREWLTGIEKTLAAQDEKLDKLAEDVHTMRLRQVGNGERSGSFVDRLEKLEVGQDVIQERLAHTWSWDDQDKYIARVHEEEAARERARKDQAGDVKDAVGDHKESIQKRLSNWLTFVAIAAAVLLDYLTYLQTHAHP